MLWGGFQIRAPLPNSKLHEGAGFSRSAELEDDAAPIRSTSGTGAVEIRPHGQEFLMGPGTRQVPVLASEFRYPLKITQQGFRLSAFLPAEQEAMASTAPRTESVELSIGTSHQSTGLGRWTRDSFLHGRAKPPHFRHRPRTVRVKAEESGTSFIVLNSKKSPIGTRRYG